MGVSIWEGGKAQELIDAIGSQKVDKQQGIVNSGKALIVGEDGIVGLGIAGLSESAKAALLNCFSHVAWIDEHGQDYYIALESALNNQAGLVRISAVFTPGTATFYTDTPLNDLKAYLTVTGYYNNGSTAQITDYALSGTLSVGTNTITVSKSGKTDTFSVTALASQWNVYAWDASSRTNPPDMTGASFDFDADPGALKVVYPQLRIPLQSNNYEAKVVCKFPYRDGVNNPKLSFNGYHNDTDAFNVMIQPNASTNVTSQKNKIAFITNWDSSSKEFTSYDETDYREYRVLFVDGVMEIYFDDVLVKTITKVDDDKHVQNSAVNLVSAETTTYDVYVKSIKIRTL